MGFLGGNVGVWGRMLSFGVETLGFWGRKVTFWGSGWVLGVGKGLFGALMGFWGARMGFLGGSPQLPEGHLELELLLGQSLHFLYEVLEGRLQFVPHLPFHLHPKNDPKTPPK